MSRRTIDVVIPCAGTAEYFEEALNSVLQQTILPQAIFVVDNGCNHSRYLDICRSANASIINYVRLEKRKPALENWQYCLSLGASEFFAFIHDDDVWNENYLKDSLECIPTTVGIVLTAHYFFNSALNNNKIPAEDIKKRVEVFDYLNGLPNSIKKLILSTSNAAHMSALVFRRAAIGFNINSKWMPDQTFFATYLMSSDVALVSSVNSFIRLSPNNGTAKVNTMGFISVETIIHLRNVIEVYVRNRELTADSFMIHLNDSHEPYIKRLKQACFSWPLNPILLNFGKDFLKAYRSHFKKKKTSRIYLSVACLYWILASLFADIVYFSKDFFSKKIIQ